MQSNEAQTIATDGKKYDLAERTAKFGESVIQFAKKIRRNAINTPLIRQLIRSSTSIGANYCEANDAISRKEFRCKVATCKKEASETKYWLRQMGTAEDHLKEESRQLWKEANELHMIIAAIFRKVSGSSDP